MRFWIFTFPIEKHIFVHLTCNDTDVLSLNKCSDMLKPLEYKWDRDESFLSLGPYNFHNTKSDTKIWADLHSWPRQDKEAQHVYSYSLIGLKLFFTTLEVRIHLVHLCKNIFQQSISFHHCCWIKPSFQWFLLWRNTTRPARHCLLLHSFRSAFAFSLIMLRLCAPLHLCVTACPYGFIILHQPFAPPDAASSVW